MTAPNSDQKTTPFNYQSYNSDLKAARAMLADKSITVEEVAKHLRVSPATLYRHLPAARAQSTEAGVTE